jgi:hypothetical protein
MIFSSVEISAVTGSEDLFLVGGRFFRAAFATGAFFVSGTKILLVLI